MYTWPWMDCWRQTDEEESSDELKKNTLEAEQHYTSDKHTPYTTQASIGITPVSEYIGHQIGGEIAPTLIRLRRFTNPMKTAHPGNPGHWEECVNGNDSGWKTSRLRGKERERGKEGGRERETDQDLQALPGWRSS